LSLGDPVKSTGVFVSHKEPAVQFLPREGYKRAFSALEDLTLITNRSVVLVLVVVVVVPNIVLIACKSISTSSTLLYWIVLNQDLETVIIGLEKEEK
jgi:hypothetical protein